MPKSTPMAAFDELRLVGAVGDQTRVEIHILNRGLWGKLGVGKAKRRKGDERDVNLALQLAFVRALQDAAKFAATDGEEQWPGYFKDML